MTLAAPFLPAVATAAPLLPLAETATPRRALRYLPATAFAIDLTVITLAGILAVVARDTFLDLDGIRVSKVLDVAGPLIAGGWIAMIALVGGYRQDVFGIGPDEYRRLLNATLLTAAAAGISCYLVQFPLSRGFFLALFVFGTPVLLTGRYLLRRALLQAHRRGLLQSRVVLSGSPEHIDEIAAALRRDTWLGYHVIGALTSNDDGAATTPRGIPVIGHTSSVATAVREHDADVVFFADNSLTCGHGLRKMVWDLESLDVQVVVAPSVADISRERVHVRPVGGLPLIHIEKPRHLQAARGAKRTFDVVGSLGLILLFAPLLALTAVRIMAHDGGPVLFRQTRVSRDGGTFRCLKFRTMVTNAEDLLAELTSDRGDDLLFKMKEDPRITAPGRWLRHYSFDELPQLLNVLRGDMSLIGPRPCLPGEYARFTTEAERRLRVRPGMTGLWQVSGRSELTFDEAVRLDVYYVDNWSMLQDLTILFRTFGAVFGSRGAY